jgi:casein kinase 1
MIILGKYKLLKKIGNGSFGTVFIGESIRTKKQVAIKLELVKADMNLLKREAQIYRFLKGGIGIPELKYFGSDKKYNFLILPVLGKSLQDTYITCNMIPCVCTKIIEIVEYIHSKGFIHRDLKPENFLSYEIMRNNIYKIDSIYVIDFGFAKKYVDEENNHIPLKTGKSIVGSINYSSVNVQEGIEASRRDDLESIIYILIFLLDKVLPWDNCFSKEVLNKKRNYNKEPIKSLLTYCRSIKFEENPDYSIFYRYFDSMV